MPTQLFDAATGMKKAPYRLGTGVDVTVLIDLRQNIHIRNKRGINDFFSGRTHQKENEIPERECDCVK